MKLCKPTDWHLSWLAILAELICFWLFVTAPSVFSSDVICKTSSLICQTFTTTWESLGKSVQTVLSQHSDSLTRGSKEHCNCRSCQIIFFFSEGQNTEQCQLSRGSPEIPHLYFMCTSIAQAWRISLWLKTLVYSALQEHERKHTQYN